MESLVSIVACRNAVLKLYLNQKANVVVNIFPGLTSHEYLPHTPSLGGTIPPSVPKLVRTLSGSKSHAPGDLFEEPSLVPADLGQSTARPTILLADHTRVQDYCAPRCPTTNEKKISIIIS